MDQDPTFPRAAGVLLHPTSLPGPHGMGDVGAGARAFVDWLASAGLSRWQVLPLVPPGPGASPYSSSSAFAGNPWLIDLFALVEHGLLDAGEIAAPAFSLDEVAFHDVFTWKRPLLQKAATRLVENKQHPLHGKLDSLVEREKWAQDYALFVALKDAHEQRPWWTWDEALVRRDKSALDRASADLAVSVKTVLATEVLFDDGWSRLRAYANERGVKLIGDIPIYVDLDSADVWGNRDQFLLDKAGRPTHVAGCPPDAFSDKGQLWGNPLYDWKRMRDDGHRFFADRLRRVLSLTDIVRIDHFRAFSAYWEIPAGDPDARGGRWVEGPGNRIFDDLQRALGSLPVIVEDLGVIDDAVVELRSAINLPGMKVLQFAFGDDVLNPYLPHSCAEHSVVYTGTHDTDTTLGWWQSAPQHTKEHVRRYLGVSGHDLVWDFIRAAFSSVAHTAIVPMQDVLALDSGARMNMPGKAHGNWGWRVRADAFHPSLALRLKDYAQLYDRDERARAHLVDHKRREKEQQQREARLARAGR